MSWSPVVKWPGCEVGHLYPSAAEVTNGWSYPSAVSTRLCLWEVRETEVADA